MNYHKIDICNMDNGNGLRCVIWVSGCSHCCKGCFNRQTWNVNSGDLFDDKQIEMIEYALSQDWCFGITITGGDPLFEQNRASICSLCKNIKAKFPDKTIWVYTGYTYEELLDMKDTTINDIIKYIDILVDGVFIEELKSPNKHWVGSSNQRVISIKESIKENKIVLYNT